MTVPHRGAPDTVVVGAGLAGLACAGDLCRVGRRVTLLEASDGPGGRMRTDRRDGFLLDRGFQVFNTSYPQVKRRLDLRSLRLRPFTPGFVAHTPTGPVRLADPTRRPSAAGALLPGRALAARDLAAAAALTAQDALLPVALLKRRPDRATSVALSRAGLSDAAVDHILRPFLSGVFLDTGFADRPVAGDAPPMPAGGDPRRVAVAVAEALATEAELLRTASDGTPVVERRAR